MRRTISFAAVFVVLSVVEAAPAGAALPVKGATYSDDFSSVNPYGNTDAGAITMKIKGNDNRKFAKVVAKFKCGEGTTPKIVFKDLKIDAGGNFAKRSSDTRYISGQVVSQNKITVQIYAGCGLLTQANFIAKR